MQTPKFSVVIICKNEANTLNRCAENLREFMARDGEVVLVDTGSTDGTAELARGLGFKVTEVGGKFLTVLDQPIVDSINKRFVIGKDDKIVENGNRLFDFAAARNFASSLATNDFIFSLDGDETYTELDIDTINSLIDGGAKQFEYQFVFAHKENGEPLIQFVQSKAFDRRCFQWEGCVHEVLQGSGERKYLGEDVVYLEHWPEPGKEHRSNYLVGLALDCYQHPEKDRQSHYFAREMMYHRRYESAIQEFKRHIGMMMWPAERAQSMIYIGDCYDMMGGPHSAIHWYHDALQVDPNRREALIKLARISKSFGNPRMTATYAEAALTIPWSDYYANDKAMYEDVPHALLYWAYGWLGDLQKARFHIQKSLQYSPNNLQYQDDTKYYYPE